MYSQMMAIAADLEVRDFLLHFFITAETSRVLPISGVF